MGVSSDMRSSRVRRQAAKKPNKERTVQVRFSDEELAALDAICSEKKMTRSAFLRSCVEKVQGGDVEPTYVVTRNADAERMAFEAKSIGVNVNQIARATSCASRGPLRSFPRTAPRTSSGRANTATSCARRLPRTLPAGSRSIPTARAAACTSMRPSRTMIWYPARPSRTAPTTRP